MCGIYGVVALRNGADLDPSAFARMAAASVHRGPDDVGEYRDAGIYLGMRRLAIIDVAGGHQPLTNEDASVQVVCNGEIYNYRELTATLERRSHRFRSRSDCEVLAHLYEDLADETVHALNGMFAFALWDARRRRLLLARDRLGIKPLYFHEDGPRLWFASEAKAILAALGRTPPLDLLALRDYLALGYVPAPRSIFERVHKLPPGHRLICEAGGFRLERFWQPQPGTFQPLDEPEWVELFRTTLDRAVQRQMVSDVPLGAFLSGGLDSSAVVACMARHSSAPIKTYSIGFAGVSGASAYNELPWARQVAQVLGTDHHEILVRPDVARLLPKLIWHLDEPLADSAFITTYLVAQLARRDVTVILSGVGGDELFGGYRRYLGASLDGYYRPLPAWIRRRVLLPIARLLPRDRDSYLGNFGRLATRYMSTADASPEDRYRAYVAVWGRAVRSVLNSPAPDDPDALDQAFQATGPADPITRLAVVDLLTQLPDDLLALTDRMTMALSLECRVPLLDNTLVDLALQMPGSLKVRGRQLKHIMKAALRGLLPPSILNRPKRGFGVPLGAWFRRELNGLVRNVLTRENVCKRGLLRWEALESALHLHAARREDYTDHLLAASVLELWAQIYLDGRSPHDVAAELVEARA